MQNLAKVTHIVLYRAYRDRPYDKKRYCLFTDVREAMSFAGSHGRYCSSMDTLKVDCSLNEELLEALCAPSTEVAHV